MTTVLAIVKFNLSALAVLVVMLSAANAASDVPATLQSTDEMRVVSGALGSAVRCPVRHCTHATAWPVTLARFIRRRIHRGSK